MRIPDFHFLDSAHNLHRLRLIKIGGDGMVRESRHTVEQYPTRGHRPSRESSIHECLRKWDKELSRLSIVGGVRAGASLHLQQIKIGKPSFLLSIRLFANEEFLLWVKFGVLYLLHSLVSA